MTQRVLGLVPARGSSKGIPRKNIRPLAGRPLLAYTAESALASHSLARVVLSTDDVEIAEVGRGLGLDVPFIRPAKLADDASPTLPVILHALDELADDSFEAVCLLQPTNPLRSAALIDECVARLFDVNADTVISVRSVPHAYHPDWVFVETNGRLSLWSGAEQPPPRRQDLPAAWHRSGAVYVTRTDVLRQSGLFGINIVGVEDDTPSFANLDTPDDWRRTENYLMAST